jgi:hypothetical protein
MFASFQIELNENIEFYIPDNSPKRNIAASNYVKCQLKDYLIGNGILDAKKIKKQWFPDSPECHVFISHSHKDIQ